MYKTLTLAAATAAVLLSACGSKETEGMGTMAGETGIPESDPGWAVGSSPPRIPGQPAHAVLIKVGEQKVLKGEEAIRHYRAPNRHDTRPIEIIGTQSLARGTMDLDCTSNVVKHDIADKQGKTARTAVDMAAAMNRTGMCFPASTPYRTMTYGEAVRTARASLEVPDITGASAAPEQPGRQPN